MDIKLEIGGKTYTFTINRKAACIIAQAQSQADEGNLLDDVFYAMLKKEHNLSRQEVGELLDVAEEEYGITQLLTFCNEAIEEVFQQAEKNEKNYKKIEFLNRKNK